MKTYRNEHHGFEIRIPEEWSAYIEGKAIAGNPLVFKCRANEAFHVETAPLTVTPFPYQVENEFRRLAEKKGCTNLIVGRFNADDKEHIFARFYMGYGQWMKKYRIILRGFDHVLTATCLDEKSLLEMEKDWDEVAASFCLIRDEVQAQSGPSAQVGSMNDGVVQKEHSSKSVGDGIRTYRNETPGFEIDVPDEWIVPARSTHSPPFDESIAFGCDPGQTFNMQIGPVFGIPTLDFTERKFREYADGNQYSDLEFGRITVEGEKHVWARFYSGHGGWTKKYLIVLGGIEYAITGTCFDFKELSKKEKRWDEIVSSFRLAKSERQDMSGIKDRRIEAGGHLYEEAYEAVTNERYQEAKRLLEQCLRENPDHVLAHKELAVVLNKLGDPQGALAHRWEVKRIDPSDVVNRFNLASLLDALGEKDASRREFDEFREMWGMLREKSKLTYPDYYFQMAMKHADKPRHLKLIYSDVPDIQYATSMLLVYQWEDELSSDLAESLKRRAAVYLACAIFDAAKSAGVPCAVSPIPNGQRPAWMVEGERAPVSLTLSDIDMDDRTLQMSIGPVVVALHSFPTNKTHLKMIMNGFRDKFSEIMV